MKLFPLLLQTFFTGVILTANVYAQTPLFISNSENVIRAEKVGSEIFFFKYADSSGTWTTQLWKTNTSISGASLVKSLGTSTVAIAGPLKIINNKLFFVADRQLWISDGTSNGTFPIYTSDYSVYDLFEFNNKLYFSVYSLQPTSNGMYVSDGTIAGTTILKSFVTRGSNEDGVSNYVKFNNKIVFTVNKGKVNGVDHLYMEIWSTDGTAGGFVRLDSLDGDARRYAGGNNMDTKSQYFREYNGYLYFVFTNAANYSADELWRTDGTVNNASYFSPGMHPIIEFNGKLILAGDASNSNIGTELSSTDGTLAGTTLIKDVNTSSPGILGSNPSNFNITCNKLYFVGVDTGINVTNRSRIWVTDGTTNGTVLYTPERGQYSPINLQSDGVLYYAYTDNNNDSVKVFMVDTTTCNSTQIMSWAYLDYGYTKQIIRLNPLFVNVSGGAATNGQAGLLGLGLITSVTDIQKGNNSQLKLSPNPCINDLHLNIAGYNCNYQIINTLGQIVQSGLVVDKVIPTDNLNKGFYILQVTDRNLNTMQVGRFVKE